MKKFVWPLEKVLKIRKQQEETIRTELFEITKQVMSIRQNIMLLQMQIRSSALGLDEDKDIIYRKMFADFAVATEKKILKLNKNLQETEKKRTEKLNEAVAARKNRKALEKLKEKAFIEYMESANKIEQNELDDIVNTVAARQLVEV